MRNKILWLNWSIINLFVVTLLSFILRTKMVFPLPLIDYNRLVESHSHFAFTGWISLALLTLLADQLLDKNYSSRPFYGWILGILVISSWSILVSYYFNGNGWLSEIIGAIIALCTYTFAWFFLQDIRKSGVEKASCILAGGGIIYLVLSSIGSFVLDYLFAIKSQNLIFYRDALFTNYHFLYNGFFTLTVFSLLFNKMGVHNIPAIKNNVYRFSVLLTISVLPTLVLSYLWHNVHGVFFFVAIIGSCLLFFIAIQFFTILPGLIKAFKGDMLLLRVIIVLSLSAFIIKTLLQSLTVLPGLGNIVFGNRPMIMGFLHLVFLGLTTLFIIFFFVREQILKINYRFTRWAIFLFTTGIVLNVGLLIGQGLGSMFLLSSRVIPWVLWAVSLLICGGAFLIVVSRFAFKNT
jgi:hypothetical protein